MGKKISKESRDALRERFKEPKVMTMSFDESKEGIVDDVFASFKKARQEFILKANLAFFLGTNEEDMVELTPEEEIMERLKWAYVKEGERRYITYVDNETYKAYRLTTGSYYDGGLILPLEEIHCEFERWCRGMDL